MINLFKSQERPPTFDGFTAAEFEEILSIVTVWLNQEMRMAADIDRDQRIYLRLLRLNLTDGQEVEDACIDTPEQRTYTRFVQLYTALLCRFGKRRMDAWSIELQTSLDMYYEDDPSALDYLFEMHPCIVLIPVLNLLSISAKIL